VIFGVGYGLPLGVVYGLVAARGAVIALAGTVAGTLAHEGARGVWFGLEIGYWAALLNVPVR
jgi:hypothetical protein